ncbi:MAG: DUF1848 domain-containing protein [Alphaproteobacteria bacterium]|nr:DUF1848 domain-containing protein [Alphaproteobacteria bacterium]MCY4496760.1 DUF1848 domain-containing protein [Rhodospirillaceae bacterium]
MIVSASYRTDIPAFYGDWFMKRLAAGRCLVTNPYGGPRYEVSLTVDDVDGFVFWTRNPAPFLPHLERIRDLGYPFVIQFTVLGYPAAVDRSVPLADIQIETFRRLARIYGPGALVWRYDPVLFSSLTPSAFHQDNFAGLCRKLAGLTDEAVISFVNPYRKSRRNLDAASRKYGFNWWEASASEATDLVGEFGRIAAADGMEATICSQPDFLVPSVRAARCIDVERLSRVAGFDIESRQKGNRPGCLCHESRDIGAYDTCPHGCAYCYAVSDRGQAVKRFTRSDSDAEVLGTPI